MEVAEERDDLRLSTVDDLVRTLWSIPHSQASRLSSGLS